MGHGIKNIDDWYCDAKEQLCKEIKECELFSNKANQTLKVEVRCQHCYFLVTKPSDDESPMREL